MNDSLTQVKCRVCKYKRVYRGLKTTENNAVYKNLRKDI